MFGRHVEALKKGRMVGERKVGTKRRRGWGGGRGVMTKAKKPLSSFTKLI